MMRRFFRGTLMSSTPDEPYVPGPGDPPAQFGRYRIVKKLGGGGMASVYLAYDTILPRQVALKVPRLDRHPHYLARFKQEASAAAQLPFNRNLCTVFETG